MTMQAPDPFIWNNEKWTFLGADNVYTLFDPKEYGLYPEMISTACYKGFIVTFRLDDSQLVLDELCVYCGDNPYPAINGIEAVADTFGMHLYKNISLKLSYSGVITIGKNMGKRFIGRAFIGPHAYEKTYELKFKNGELIDKKDTSGTYSGF